MLAGWKCFGSDSVRCRARAPSAVVAGKRRRPVAAAAPLEREVERHGEPGGGRFEVALDAGDLAGEADARRVCSR